jgi:uracil-DNA glycosylase
MCGTPVHGPAIQTDVMLVGQAPGAHEAARGHPFAHTAGKTLFRWLHQATGWDEEDARQRIYIASIARCFPGKAAKGSGDREPDAEEIANCRRHLSAEVLELKPKVILAVGKLAIAEVLGPELFPKGATLADVVGKRWSVRFHGVLVQVIALPHPSGVSRWPNTEPGKTLLAQALRQLGPLLPHRTS